MSEQVRYSWTDMDGGELTIDEDRGLPWIQVEWSSAQSVELPTAPDEVRRLIETILAVTGMQALDEDWTPTPR